MSALGLSIGIIIAGIVILLAGGCLIPYSGDQPEKAIGRKRGNNS